MQHFQLSVMSHNRLLADSRETIMTPARRQAIFFPPGYIEQFIPICNMIVSLNFYGLQMESKRVVLINQTTIIISLMYLKI